MAIRAPADTELLGDFAQQIKTLAEDADATVPTTAYAAWTGAVTTNANGDVGLYFPSLARVDGCICLSKHCNIQVGANRNTRPSGPGNWAAFTPSGQGCTVRCYWGRKGTVVPNWPTNISAYAWGPPATLLRPAPEPPPVVGGQLPSAELLAFGRGYTAHGLPYPGTNEPVYGIPGYIQDLAHGIDTLNTATPFRATVNTATTDANGYVKIPLRPGDEAFKPTGCVGICASGPWTLQATLAAYNGYASFQVHDSAQFTASGWDPQILTNTPVQIWCAYW